LRTGASQGENNEKRDQFLTCLADLAENSIPRELSDRLADNPKLAEQLDFSSTGCKFVAALREEYLPHLDDLRKMPALASASSRVRLKEMDGEQALQAVSMPGRELVTAEVSENIVRVVAGNSEGKPFRELEVAPAILSLFCQALNNKRVERNLPQVTNDLVMGSAGAVIDDFYHYCVNDKPAAVRRLIEDKLVTESGYRDSIDLDDAKMQLERAGVPGSVLYELVDKRVLGIEDYGGQLRLELTHDVLLEPVKRRREQRRLRAAQEPPVSWMRRKKADLLFGRVCSGHYRRNRVSPVGPLFYSFVYRSTPRMRHRSSPRPPRVKAFES